MPKQDTLTLLRDLESFGLSDPLFRTKLHHLGGTMNGFRAFASNVGYFRKYGCNQLLHDRLEYIRKQCENGALQKGTRIEELVSEAKRNVPCRAYIECKNHISDSACRD